MKGNTGSDARPSLGKKGRKFKKVHHAYREEISAATLPPDKNQFFVRRRDISVDGAAVTMKKPCSVDKKRRTSSI